MDRRSFLKLASFALAGVSTASLAGCTSRKSDEIVAPTSFRIGGIGAVTGANSIYGPAAHFGAQVAIDEINAKGRRTYQLNWQDDESNSAQAATCYQNLKDWGAQIILGPLLTDTARAVASRTAYDNVFMVTPSASSRTVLGSVSLSDELDETNRYSNVYAACPDDVSMGKTAAEAIAQISPKARIGVLYDEGSFYSKGISKAFLSRAAQLRLNVLSLKTFIADGQKGFVEQLYDAQAKKINFLFMPLYCAQAATVIKQAVSLDYHPRFMGADGLDGILNLEGFDKDLAEGVLFLSTFTGAYKKSQAQQFIKKYKQLVDGVQPTHIAACAYDCIYVLDALLAKSGCDPQEPAPYISQKLKRTILDDFNFTGLTGENITWTDLGTCSKVGEVMIVKHKQATRYNALA